MGDNSSLMDLLLIPRSIKVSTNGDEVHLAIPGNASPYHDWPSPKGYCLLDIAEKHGSGLEYDHPPYAIRNDSHQKSEPSAMMQCSSEDVDYTRQVMLLCELETVLYAWFQHCWGYDISRALFVVERELNISTKVMLFSKMTHVNKSFMKMLCFLNSQNYRFIYLVLLN